MKEFLQRPAGVVGMAPGLHDGQGHILRPEGGVVHRFPVLLGHAVAPGDGVEPQIVGLWPETL